MPPFLLLLPHHFLGFRYGPEKLDGRGPRHEIPLLLLPNLLDQILFVEGLLLPPGEVGHPGLDRLLTLVLVFPPGSFAGAKAVNGESG